MAKQPSPRQRRFIEEYLVDLNAAQAAIRAGYAVSGARQQGHRLLTDVDIQADISARQRERAKRIGIDQDWVLKRLVMLVERCMQHEPVTDANGTPTGEYRFDAAGAHRGLHSIGKHLGMFVDRRIVGVKRFKDMNDDELRHFIGDLDDWLDDDGTDEDASADEAPSLARTKPAGSA